MKADKRIAHHKANIGLNLRGGIFILSFLAFVFFARESLAYNAPVESRSEDNNISASANSGSGAYTQPYVENNITFEPVDNSRVSNSTTAPSQQVVYGEEESRSPQLLDKVARLEQEIRDLRGQLEEQAHIIKRLEKQAKLQEVTPNKPVASDSVNGVKPQLTEQKKSTLVSTADEQQVYKDAYTLLRNKQYSQAIPAMKNYIDTYPSGQFVENAHYWLGELYLLQGDAGAARNEFSQIVTKFPSSAKVPDAMLKLGTISAEANQWPDAKKQLKDILTRYPESSAAKLAEQRLQQIELAGH